MQKDFTLEQANKIMNKNNSMKYHVDLNYAIDKLRDGYCVNEIGIKYSSMGCKQDCYRCYKEMLEECKGIQLDIDLETEIKVEVKK